MVSFGAMDTAPGMPSGAHRPDVLREEHLGRPQLPMGLEPVVLLGRLVDSRLGPRARIGVYHSMPTPALAGGARENPRPTYSNLRRV